MGLFRKKKALTPEQRREQAMAERRQQMLVRLKAALENDPAFQLSTFDGLNWIDPFSAMLVPAPFEFKIVAMRHFQQHNHWRGKRPKPLVDLRTTQWLHYLQEHYDGDSRFHFFTKEGNWLNPLNGKVSAAVIKRSDAVTPDVLRNMARVLASFKDSSPDRLLPANELAQRFPTLSPEYEHDPNEVTDDMISADEMVDNWEEIGRGKGLFDEMTDAGHEEGQIETQAYERPMARRAEPLPPSDSTELRTPTEPIGEPYQAKVKRGSGSRKKKAPEEPAEETERKPAKKRRRRKRRKDDSERYERDDDSERYERDDDSERYERDDDSERHEKPKRKRQRKSKGKSKSKDKDTDDTTRREEGSPKTSFHELYAPPGQHDSEDLKQARVVQDNLMGTIPELKGIDFGLHFEPYAHIGGDFYDFIQLDDTHLCFIVGDVSGHGTQAALVVGSILKSLHYLLNQASAFDLTEILCRLNEDVRGDLVSGQFFTAFIGLLQTGEQRKMQAICAGHHPSVCINPNGPNFMRRVGKNGMALGVATNAILRKQLRITTEHFIPGDTLCVYTDGVHEAMNRDGQEFGHWRARSAFLGHIQADVGEMVKAVAMEAKEFARGQPQDDMTVLAIRFK